MKMLFWKEWHELRALPLGAAVAVSALMTGLMAVTRGHNGAVPTAEAQFILVGVWLFFGAVAGANTIATEIGTGTLQFLSSLPIGRRTIWWVKSGAALGILFSSMLSSTIIWMLLCAPWRPSNTQFLSSFMDMLAVSLPFLLSVFAIALAISPLVDHYLRAVVVAVIAAIGIASLFLSIVNKYSGGHDMPLLFTLIGLSIPTFAAISYWTFTRGETLRDRRRFRAAGAAAGICLAIDAIIVLTAGALGAW